MRWRKGGSRVWRQAVMGKQWVELVIIQVRKHTRTHSWTERPLRSLQARRWYPCHNKEDLKCVCRSSHTHTSSSLNPLALLIVWLEQNGHREQLCKGGPAHLSLYVSVPRFAPSGTFLFYSLYFDHPLQLWSSHSVQCEFVKQIPSNGALCLRRLTLPRLSLTT